MLKLEVLQELDLGNPVAEHDLALERYFIETDAFRRIVRDEADIIAGDKGTGKTALFTILQQRYRTIEELSDVEVLPAFNPSGSPVFQRLTEGDPYSEAQYGTLWKSYFLSLVGNWLLAIYGDDVTDEMKELRELLRGTGLLHNDDSPNTVFSGIVNLWRRITNPAAMEMPITIGPLGIPIVSPRVEFAEPATDDDGAESDSYVPHEEAYSLLNKVLDDLGITVWLVLDRLDEAFAGNPAAEVPALRALLRSYLDLLPYQAVRLKLFVRRDLFRRVTTGGFVNLTHVNARRIDIIWDDQSLSDLLQRRIAENLSFLGVVGCDSGDDDCIFSSLFPEQVDPGDRKPKTWPWMMSRIKDGNDVRPPRNLIDLVQKSLIDAIRREERDRTEYTSGVPLIGSESLKAGLRALSSQRVEDTLLAEASEEAPLIERFRSGKAEHNRDSLKVVLGGTDDELESRIGFLREIGFLEASGDSYKVPMLYRDGLTITQGKAFDPTDLTDEDE